jgi:hypothetical protein
VAKTAVRDFDLDLLGSEFTGIEAERFELTFGSGSSVGMEGRHIDDGASCDVSLTTGNGAETYLENLLCDLSPFADRVCSFASS